MMETKSEILKLRARLKYRFIDEHRTVWGVMTMCRYPGRVLCVVENPLAV
ncbi:hypothetical protein [Citrobacter farmeri]|nr:hypothetical protein [Citrobacter farmeri]MDB2167000.1 hypothetical protein [Citrobacter farmeri]